MADLSRDHVISYIEAELLKIKKLLENPEFDTDKLEERTTQMAYWVRRVRMANTSLLQNYSDIHKLVNAAAKVAYVDLEDDDDALETLETDIKAVEDALVLCKKLQAKRRG